MDQTFLNYYQSLVEKNPDHAETIANGAASLHEGGNPTVFPTLNTLLEKGKEWEDAQPWEITKGFKSGVQNMQATAYGMGGLIGDVVESDKMRDWGFEGYKRNMEEAAEFTPAVSDIRDVDSVDSAADWTMGTIGTLAPSVLEAIGSAILGGGVAGVAAKTAGKKAVEKAVARQVKNGLTKEIAEKFVLDKIKDYGQKAGITAGVGSIESGGMFGEAAEDVGVENVNAPLIALLGAISGGSEIIAPMGMLAQTVGGKALRTVAREVKGSFKKNAAKEAGQEIFQEGLGDTSALLHNPDKEIDAGKYWNTAVAGALGGTAFHGMNLGLNYKGKKSDSEDDAVNPQEKSQEEAINPSAPQDIMESAKEETGVPFGGGINEIAKNGLPEENLTHDERNERIFNPAEASADTFTKPFEAEDNLRKSAQGMTLLNKQLSQDQVESEQQADQDFLNQPFQSGLTPAEESAMVFEDQIADEEQQLQFEEEQQQQEMVNTERLRQSPGGMTLLNTQLKEDQVKNSPTRKMQERNQELLNDSSYNARVENQGIIEQTDTQEYPEGINLSSRNKPFRKSGAKRASERHTKQTGEQTEIVQLGENDFGWKVVEKEVEQINEQTEPAIIPEVEQETIRPITYEMDSNERKEITARNKEIEQKTEPVKTDKPANINTDFIEKQVNSLGSLEAVQEFYNSESKVDSYARDYAGEVYSEIETGESVTESADSVLKTGESVKIADIPETVTRKPAATPSKRIGKTSKSVRDNPQRAVVDNGIIRIINKNGRKTVKKTEFPQAKWEELENSFGNPAWHKREYIKSLETVVADDTPESHSLKERIIDAQVSAVDDALKEYRKVYGINEPVSEQKKTEKTKGVSEKQTPEEITASENKNLSEFFAEKFRRDDSKSYNTISAARKEAGEFLGEKVKPGTELAKRVDEEIELSSVVLAREIVESDRSQEYKYNKLVGLMHRLPKLGTRTSTSIKDQAYSTPLPLAFVASELAGINNTTDVYEPSAGNGALLIGAAKENITANELNTDRYEALKSQGFKTVTNLDAMDNRPEYKQDAIITNPPFGSVKDPDGKNVEFKISEDYSTTQVDHAIAMKALKDMKADGRAVLLVGSINPEAKTEAARKRLYRAKHKRSFYFNLYNGYNVTKHFTVTGDMYKQQGAAWPVDVIVIEGKGKSNQLPPGVKLPEVISSYTNLREVLNEENSLGSNRSAGSTNTSSSSLAESRTESQDTDRLPVSSIEESSGLSYRPARRSSVELDGDTAREGNAVTERTDTDSTGSRSVSDRGKSTDQGSIRDDGSLAEPSTRTESDRSDSRKNTTSRSNTRDGQLSKQSIERKAKRAKKKEQNTERESDTQSTYIPESDSTPLGTLTPANMQRSISKALNSLSSEYGGNIDKYVADELGYKVEDLSKYFAAEQVDALALALDNMSNNSGFIIGDQTGIGKGRVVAGIIRHAIKNGKTPIFVTEKPVLYKDMFRDLVDIGMPESIADKILMTNGGAKISLKEDNSLVLKSAAAKTHNSLLSNIKNLSDNNFEAIFTTYDQMNEVGSKRRDFLQKMAKNNGVLILDESHNAGGSGTERVAKAKPGQPEPYPRSKFVRDMIKDADSVFYSSATYAKRADVMDLYSKTDISLAVEDIKKLPEVISKGGIPLQQVVATMLTRAGQYVRRERSFEGVSYNTTPVKVDHKAAESISTSLRDIRVFDDYVQVAIDGKVDDATMAGGSVSARKGVGEGGITSSNFTSVMHNLIDQSLLSLKTESAINEAISALKRGEKPVITLANTMGAFIDDYAANLGLKTGDDIDISYNDVIHRYLEKTREYSEENHKGEKVRKYLTDAELGHEGVSRYNAVKKSISRMPLKDMPVSPVDYIKYRIKQAGYRVDEITGRSTILDYTDSGLVVSKRKNDNTARAKAINGFNNGMVDVLILNQSGSTGISLHTSEKNPIEGQAKRHMIILQAEKNIDTHMQMLGRVHRTGQVIPPSYSQLVADIPAEKRPAAVLSAKMASLNANTTASKKSDFTAKDAPDFMNTYGDKVCAVVMENYPELHRKLGKPLKPTKEGKSGLGHENAARKITGRIPMLTLKEQENLYSIIESEYSDLISQLDATGENILEAKTLDLDAKTLEKKMIFNARGKSPFQEKASAEYVDMKRIGKPYTSKQVEGFIEAEKGKTPTAESVKARSESYYQKEIERIEESKKDDSDSIEQSTDKLKERLQRNFLLWKNTTSNLPIGQSVQLSIPSSDVMLDAVVIKIEQKGEPNNPVALGTWKVTFAVADGTRRFTVPFTRISETAHPEDGYVGYQTSYKDVIPLFDQAQTMSREKRTMITGNLLAGYDQFKLGRIVNYTNKKGEINQGILLPRNFDLKEASAEKDVIFRKPVQAMKFLAESDKAMVSTQDAGITISQGRYGDYNITTPASKARGGKYFLNSKILKAIDRDFVKSGSVMTATVDKSLMEKVVRVLHGMGESLKAADHLRAEAREYTGDKVLSFDKGKTTTQQLDSKLTDIEVDYQKSKHTQYSTGNEPGTPIAKQDLEAIPFVKKVTGREGNFRLHFKNDISVPLKTVTLKGDDAFIFTPEGEKIQVRGSFNSGQGIEISQHGDIYTVTHENLHFFESIGLIDSNDKRLLNRAGEKMFGKTKDKKELRAKYVEAVSRKKDSDSVVKKIFQKVQEFIDQLINVFGRDRTAGAVIRDIESGKIFDNEVTPDLTSEGVTQYSTADIMDELKDIPSGIKAVFQGIGKSHPSDKKDIGLAARAFNLLSHSSKTVPALNRAWNHALEKDDTKNRVENELTDDEKYTKTVKSFQKKHREEYNGLYKKWLDDADINQRGYSVKQEGEEFVIFSPKNDLGRRLKTKYKMSSEFLAWEKVHELEGVDYRAAGGSNAGVKSLRIFRTMTDNIYNRMSKQMKDLEYYCENEQIPVPMITEFVDGEKVQISLKRALERMGDRRGYYFPRMRSNGSWQIFGTKNGEHSEFTFHDSKATAILAANKLRRKGYKVGLPKKSDSLSEDLFALMGSTLSTEAALNAALDKTKFGLKDIGIKGKFEKNGSYVLTGEFRKEYIDALENIGGKYRYKKTTDGAHGEWRFENPTPNIEKEVKELLFQTQGTLPKIAVQFAEATASQLANVLRGRGARSSMISRSDAKGKEVIKGYEEDPNTAILKAVRGVAGAEAKADMALKMVMAMSGQDVGWEDFKAIKAFEGEYEGFEKMQLEAGETLIDRETFNKIKEGDTKPLYSKYLELKNDRKIDPAKQKNAWSEGMDLFKDMLRNEESVDRIIGTLKGAAVVKYLGFRVAAPVVNMTNMVAGVPAAMMGYGNIPANKALRLIGKSYKQYYKYNKGQLSGVEKKVFEEIEKRGWDQAQFNQEALGAIQNNMQNAWGKTVDMSMKMFGFSEKLNRVATISASYKGLEKSMPELTFEERIMKAKEISDKAHGIYTKANRPAMLRGGHVGAKVMQMAYVFKTFTHNYLATMVDLGVRERDAKAVGWMLFAPAIFGTGSSIGATALIKAIGEAMGSDEPEEDFYKFCENYGAGNLARFGITGFGEHGISLKGSLQIGLTDLPTSFEDLWGAPGSVLTDVFEGIEETIKGNISKGIEKMLPLAASSPFKALREHGEGITTRSNTPVFFEDKPLRADTIDMWQRIFSFNPSRIAGIREKMWAEKLLKKKYQESRSDIYQRLRRLYLSKNPSKQEHDDILEMIAIYNAVAKKKGQTLITRKSIKTTLKKMMR